MNHSQEVQKQDLLLAHFFTVNRLKTSSQNRYLLLTQAPQPTTSVDTSSWFDQAGGGQPKDVSSLFADDAESVPAQASQAPPPVAQVLGLVCA